MAPELGMGGNNTHITGNLHIEQPITKKWADIRVSGDQLAMVRAISQQVQPGEEGYAISATPDNDGNVIYNGRVVKSTIYIVASGLFVNKIRNYIRWLS